MLPTESGIDIVVMRRSSEDDESCAAFAVLSADERRRADHFIKPRDRQRFIARRAQLRTLLGDRLGVTPGSVRLSFAPAITGRSFEMDGDIMLASLTCRRLTDIARQRLHATDGLSRWRLLSR